MEFVIISGMSGAGKSCAIHAFEDMGYSCADNVPPELIDKFAEICCSPHSSLQKMALVVDSRSAELFSQLPSALDNLTDRGIDYKLLFLDTSNDVLLKRYKETRRRHPLMQASYGSLSTAIAMEREKIQLARNRADYIIDTTNLSNKALMGRLHQLFSSGDNTMGVTVMSFGYKYGIPQDVDLVFDVRCLPNPFYKEELREQRGYDKDVYDYVFMWDVSKKLKYKLENLIDFLLPMYVEEGKTSLVIAFGCTGGQHRSVAFAQSFSKFIEGKNYHVTLVHRDADK